MESAASPQSILSLEKTDSYFSTSCKSISFYWSETSQPSKSKSYCPNLFKASLLCFRDFVVKEPCVTPWLLTKTFSGEDSSSAVTHRKTSAILQFHFRVTALLLGFIRLRITHLSPHKGVTTRPTSTFLGTDLDCIGSTTTVIRCGCRQLAPNKVFKCHTLSQLYHADLVRHLV